MSNATSFRGFCRCLQQIADTRGSKSKTRLFSAWLNTLQSAEEIELSVRWAAEGAFPKISGRKAVLGPALTGSETAKAVGIPYETVFKTSKNALGSTTETIEKLLENIYWHHRELPEPINLKDTQHWFEKLEKCRGTTAKITFLHALFQAFSPLEVKYFLRIAGQHSLRIGFEEKSVLNAVADAFSAETSALQKAHTFTGNAGETGRRAFQKNLEEVTFSLFHPVPFMLAAAWESGEDAEIFPPLVAEPKLDGMRAQIHASGQEVRIFSRDLNDVSGTFPDLCAFFKLKNLDPVLLDGEIVVFRQGDRPDFNALQQRLGVKSPKLSLIQSYPVHFVAYDLLFNEEQVLFDRPFKLRRTGLETFCKTHGISVSETHSVKSSDEIKTLFQKIRESGHEGLMLKTAEGTYASGQRKKTWMKVKEPARSLTTAILYAHSGSGKRGGYYSDFTLGVRISVATDSPFVPIGKAYGGYTDDDLKKLNQALKTAALERFGPTLMVKPEIVVELEFDEIQLNPRTKAGFSLRFPRFKRIRWDLSAPDADTLEEVRSRYKNRTG